MKKLTLLSICFTSVLSIVTSGAIAGTHAHNAVPPLNSDVIHSWIKNYIPAVRFEGCEPYPAVGPSGNKSEGLQDSGTRRGGCSTTSFGQVYARTRCWKNNPKYGNGTVCGTMFAYYFPKDVNWEFAPNLGHRHDWEDIIVFTRNGKVIGAAFSGHGDYISLQRSDITVWGTRVVGVYRGDGPTHRMSAISGSTQNTKVIGKVLEWEAISSNMRNALDSDWGSANFPMGKNFTTNINDGWHSDWKTIN